MKLKVSKVLIDRLKRKAAKSLCKFRVAALGFNVSNICVATSTNLSLFRHKGGGKHAEEVLFEQAKRKGITKILICRIGSGGTLLPIDPCERCSKKAKKLRIVIETVPIGK
ncbi:MAG TPA: hypothetical protein VGB37_05180 [Candidatus Lokiarchaeia archaeon]